jgi:hypothetical protein
MAILLWMAQRLQDPVAPVAVAPALPPQDQVRRWPAFAAAAAMSVVFAGVFAGLAAQWPNLGFAEGWDVHKLLRLDAPADGG